MNAKDILKKLCEELNLGEFKSNHSGILKVANELKKCGKYIIVDEAEHLKWRVLETLRRIMDFSKQPLILVGTHWLADSISSGRLGSKREQELAQLRNRCLGRYELKGLQKKEYVEICKDEDLINLHRIIQTRPQSLQIELNRMLNGRDFFLDSIHKKPRNNIEKAALYFYSIVHSFGGKRDNYAMCKKARSVKNIYKIFQVYAERLKPVSIENLDFREFIKRYDSDVTLFYLDPPYVGTENYYKNKKIFDLKDHKDLCKLLKKIKGKFLLSYNDCELVRNLYKSFTIETLETKYRINMQTQNVKRKELLVRNY